MAEDGGRQGDLTSAERDLVAAVAAGRRAEMHGQDIRAAVLRDLATERYAEWPVAPVGIDVHNATIKGELDLEGCVVAKPLAFLKCRFAAPAGGDTAIRVRDAQMKRLAFFDCAIDGALKADRVHVATAVFLNASTVMGELRLRGATIGEALTLESTRIENPGDVAILADGLRLGGPWILRTATVRGEIRLAGARIGGGLLWEDLQAERAGVVINADGAIGEGVWVLRRAKLVGALRLRGISIKAIDAQGLEINAGSEAFNARAAEIASDLILEGARITGGILLGRARVGGEVSVRGAIIKGPGDDWAIAAAGITIAQGLSLAGAQISGGFNVAGARITQGISASHVVIVGRGRAIEADVVHLGGNWIMRGAKIQGSVRFAGAQIDGQVGFTESTIEGSGDLAIRADGAHIRGGWFMGRADIRGLVRLPAAVLGNEMRLRGTKICVKAGPALYANGVKIARELVLDGGFEAVGGVALDHAEIAGTLDLSESKLQSAILARDGAPTEGTYDAVLQARYDEAAISLVDARLDRLVMPEKADHRPKGVVDLSRAHIGSYEDAASAWPPTAAERRKLARRNPQWRDLDHLVLDGFVYDHLQNPAGVPSSVKAARVDTAKARLRWLEGQSGDDLDVHFKPQAWMQLSRRLVAQGFHDDAREIAIARRRRHRRGASASRAAKLQGMFLDLFALYGFNPWRTVLWSVFFVMLFAGIWAWASRDCERADCKDETVYVMALKGNFGQDDTRAAANYPPFAPLAYSLDVFLPFISLGFEDHWRPRTSHRPLASIEIPASPMIGYGPRRVTLTLGQVLYAVYVAEMIIGLVLTSLAVTAFTGLLRGEEEPR